MFRRMIMKPASTYILLGRIRSVLNGRTWSRCEKNRSANNAFFMWYPVKFLFEWPHVMSVHNGWETAQCIIRWSVVQGYPCRQLGDSPQFHRVINRQFSIHAWRLGLCGGQRRGAFITGTWAFRPGEPRGSTAKSALGPERQISVWYGDRKSTDFHA
jgi:hypothetical protein